MSIGGLHSLFDTYSKHCTFLPHNLVSVHWLYYALEPAGPSLVPKQSSHTQVFLVPPLDVPYLTDGIQEKSTVRINAVFFYLKVGQRVKTVRKQNL